MVLKYYNDDISRRFSGTKTLKLLLSATIDLCFGIVHLIRRGEKLECNEASLQVPDNDFQR